MVSYILLICSTSGKGRCEGKAHMAICQQEKKRKVMYVVMLQ
jgi:hypothetical protein